MNFRTTDSRTAHTTPTHNRTEASPAPRSHRPKLGAAARNIREPTLPGKKLSVKVLPTQRWAVQAEGSTNAERSKRKAGLKAVCKWAPELAQRPATQVSPLLWYSQSWCAAHRVLRCSGRKKKEKHGAILEHFL